MHSGVTDYSLKNFQIADAGEHGCRFGGTRYQEQPSSNISVRNGRITQSGQSGVKFFTGKKGQRFRNVELIDVDVVDCQYVPERPEKRPGFNDEGFLLQQVTDGKLSGLTVSRERSKTGYSCDCGLYISGASDLHIRGVWAEGTLRDFIRVSQWDDGVGKASVESLPSTDVNIFDAVGNRIGGSALFLDFPTETIAEGTFQIEASGTSKQAQKSVSGNLGSRSVRGNVQVNALVRDFKGGVEEEIQRSAVRIRGPLTR